MDTNEEMKALTVRIEARVTLNVFETNGVWVAWHAGLGLGAVAVAPERLGEEVRRKVQDYLEQPREPTGGSV